MTFIFKQYILYWNSVFSNACNNFVRFYFICGSRYATSFSRTLRTLGFPSLLLQSIFYMFLKSFLTDFGELGSPISTTKLQNGVDTARHGLILRQHGATAYTELLEAYFHPHRTFFICCLMLTSKQIPDDHFKDRWKHPQ